MTVGWAFIAILVVLCLVLTARVWWLKDELHWYRQRGRFWREQALLEASGGTYYGVASDDEIVVAGYVTPENDVQVVELGNPSFVTTDICPTCDRHLPQPGTVIKFKGDPGANLCPDCLMPRNRDD